MGVRDRIYGDVPHRLRRGRLAGVGGHRLHRTFPGQPAVEGAEEARLLGVEGIAEAEVEDVGGLGIHRQGADRRRAELLIGDGLPGAASIKSLPDASARGGEVEDARLGRVRDDAAHAARVLRLEDDAVELDVGAGRSEVHPDPVRRGGRERRERRFADQRAARADPFPARDLEHAESRFRSEFALLEGALRRLAGDCVIGFG